MELLAISYPLSLPSLLPLLLPTLLPLPPTASQALEVLLRHSPVALARESRRLEARWVAVRLGAFLVASLHSPPSEAVVASPA